MKSVNLQFAGDIKFIETTRNRTKHSKKLRNNLLHLKNNKGDLGTISLLDFLYNIIIKHQSILFLLTISINIIKFEYT